MRWSTCLWGGRSNPIIPVGNYPACWREHHTIQNSDRDVAREYMKFFEPDVLVETEPGLAASIGYGALADDSFETQLLGLDDLYSSEDDYPPELRFGLSILDVYRDIYQSQRQFVLRDSRPALLFGDVTLSPIVETAFGAFPQETWAQSFLKSYIDVFQPVTEDLNVDHWVRCFVDRETNPFLPTHHKISLSPGGWSKLSFFIFDHTKSEDLIDYWNMRLFETPVYPIPLCWLQDLSPTIVDMITNNHRPIPNNPSGGKLWSIIYFGRSINRDMVDELTRDHLADCPMGAFHIGNVLHPRVLTERLNPLSERHALKVDGTTFDTELTEGNAIRFDAVYPGFADPFGNGHYRWVNVVNLTSYRTDTLALTYPSNLEDRTTPRLCRALLKQPVITREGWVIGQTHAEPQELIELSDGPSAIGEWLARKEIKSKLSGAGRIAKQMIESLGGLQGSHLIADDETIRLLNKMATQEVVRGAGDIATLRQYEGRTVNAKEWEGLISKRRNNRSPRLTLDEFTEHGILKLGLAVGCTSCAHGNWFSLDDVGYEVTCERCQKIFPFPQRPSSTQWKYRITGPFSVPNYAEGSYCVTLTLNLFRLKLVNAIRVEMTYATGLTLTHDDFEREVDFAFWHSESAILGQRTEPRFVFGEAKSFAEEAVTDHDIESLKIVADAVPGSIVVVSVLKAAFSDAEKKRLAEFTKWGWERIDGRSRAQVLLLTGIELFADFNVRMAWKSAGSPYPEDAGYHVLGDLDAVAHMTQRIHLGLDHYATASSPRSSGSPSLQ